MSDEDKLREKFAATYEQVLMDFEAELQILLASPPSCQRAWDRQRQAIRDAVSQLPDDMKRRLAETINDWPDKR